MTDVSVSCRNFSGAMGVANGTHVRDISYRAVLRACITLGAQRFSDVLSLGWRDFAHRFGVGFSSIAFLVQSPSGLSISPRFASLDMSEKGATSYWYGMIMAKLIAESELHIPWLAHVDQMRRSGTLATNTGSNSRGDLVGWGMNNWHVIEAKGRSNSYPKTLVTNAKQQAAMVTSINNCAPATTSACITSLSDLPISVLLDDPPGNDEGNGKHWRVSEDDFFRQYYRWIVDYLREFGPYREQTIGNAEFVTAPLFPFFLPMDLMFDRRKFAPQIEIGLLSSIFASPERALAAVANLPSDDRGYVGSDGIALLGRLPDWEEV